MQAFGTSLFPRLAAYLARVQVEVESIPADRKAELGRLAAFVRERGRKGETARLTFICTHNSRRSLLAQVWAQTAAHACRAHGVECYSGGASAAAFDPRAVAALERAGFRVETRGAGNNPVVAVRLGAELPPVECFSKRYDQPPNPTRDFCAVMNCADNDQGCPVVLGAAERITIPYDDPKAADGTPAETAVYDECCRQIAREMLFTFVQSIA